ncbi:MAG: helix-turn-helix transcriptional regulator [Mycobacteriales bacterium]|nr:hypothetical protein [Frankia sp.]
MPTEVARAARAIQLLADDVRRRLYFFVRARRSPVTRAEAAASAGVSQKLAGFHLDRLVDEGLLTAHYARPAGRSGPGAGRTARMYEPSAAEIAISVPERRYDLAGELLVDALVTRARDEAAEHAAARVAYDAGHTRGDAARARAPRADERRLVNRELAALGFEPHRDSAGDTRLGNCPFHALASRNASLVCGMNHAFVRGLLAGVSSADEAILDPQPSHCCVRIQPSGARA